MLIDSHAHLNDPVYDADRDDVIRRAGEAGVGAIVTIGCDLESSRRAVELADRYKMIYATIGVHPHEVKLVDDTTLTELQKLAAHKKVIGFGEIGLDYFYLHSPRETQQRRFRQQIAQAKMLGLPIVVHSRDAKSDTLSILKEERVENIGGVMHCFTGDLEMARIAMEMNFYISFAGVLTFTNATAVREVARALPMDRILLETDCPYLSPVPNRGRRNEPAYIRYTAEVLARLHPDQTPESIMNVTAENAARLFKIKI
ncbi:MAG TPA: TatD family hydrolase [Nitrospiria bacterium]|nr:TatD family hydrolase [Nitrospiria bacterium]